MKRYLALVTVLVIAACGKQQEGTTTADSVGAGAAMPVDTMRSMPQDRTMTDSTMVRDSATP